MHATIVDRFHTETLKNGLSLRALVSDPSTLDQLFKTPDQVNQYLAHVSSTGRDFSLNVFDG
jgi:hypothetical protein